MGFITLSCPSCGAKLQITNDLDRFACAFCGTEILVNRQGGTVALKPILEGIRQVRQGIDLTTSELTIRRLKDEIGELEIDKFAIEKHLKQNKKNVSGDVVIILLGIFLLLSGYQPIHTIWPCIVVFLIIIPLGFLTLGINNLIKWGWKSSENEQEIMNRKARISSLKATLN
jgi:DNA-directed RNA polymerase subunit RPC12/RpoP